MAVTPRSTPQHKSERRLLVSRSERGALPAHPVTRKSSGALCSAPLANQSATAPNRSVSAPPDTAVHCCLPVIVWKHHADSPHPNVATPSSVNLLFARVCIEHPLDMGKLAEVWHRTLRRLEDRIRYLCWKALKARDDELGALFSERRSALHEHANRLRQLAAPKFAIAKEALLSERCSRPAHRNDGGKGVGGTE